MKSIKELREQYQVITEKEDKEQRKLTALVRAGLFDAKKLPVLKRALEKGVDEMSSAEKKILIDLLDSLMNQVISNEPVYMKVKRNVQSMDEEFIAEVAKTPVTIADVPSIVVLKRKAVRVYPGGQQVGLYYSQQLDKYVTIPFGESGISEEVDLDEASNWIERRRDERAEETPYHLMTPDQKNRTKPLKVLGRSASRGDSKRETAARFLMSLIQRKKKRRTIPEEVDLNESYSNYRRRSRDDYKDDRAEETPYDLMTPDQKDRTKTIKVLGRSVARGDNTREVIARTLFAFMQGGIAKKSRLKKLKAMRASPQRKTKIANRAAQIVQQRVAQTAANAANAAPKQSAATSGTMQNRIRQVAKQKTISEKVALKEAVLLNLAERHQTNEVFQALVPLALAAGRAALPYVARGAAAAGPALGRLAGKTFSKGKRFLNKFKNKRKRKRDLDLDLDLDNDRDDYYRRNNSGSSGPLFDRSKFAKDVTYTQRQTRDPTIVGAQWNKGTDAPVDPATARRERNKFYSQPQQQNESIVVNLDGNTVEINSSIAEKLLNVYESLNENNKQKMVDMLLNEETQNKIVEFVRRY